LAKFVRVLVVAFLLSLVIFPTSSLAKTGDFYEGNKTFFEEPGNLDDENRSSNAYIEILKNYDDDSQSIECGKFQVTCHIYKFIFETGVSALEFIKEIMKKTVISPTDIIQNPLYERYQDGLFTLSKTVLAIFIVFSMTKIMSLRMADADDGPIVMNEKLVSIFVICVFLFLYESIIYWILNFQEKLMTAIIDTIKTEKMVENMITNILLSPGVFAFITVLVIGIILVVLTLQFFYRIALVAILYIIGPIAIVTKVNDTFNFFDFWLKQFISAFLTLALQLIATAIGLQRFFERPQYFGDTTNLFIGTAFFILAVTLPSLLGQWGLSTGSARSVMSGAKTIARVAIRR